MKNDIQNLGRANSGCDRDYDYNQLRKASSIQDEPTNSIDSTIGKAKSSIEMDSNRSNSCPPSVASKN